MAGARQGSEEGVHQGADQVTARPPYDFRHAGVSLRLNAGTPATQVAEWAGHSVEILQRVYAHCRAGSTGTFIVRGDSAFYSAKVVAACRASGACFSVTARMDVKIKVAIATLGEDEWIPIKYPNAIYDEASRTWISEAPAYGNLTLSNGHRLSFPGTRPRKTRLAGATVRNKVLAFVSVLVVVGTVGVALRAWGGGGGRSSCGPSLLTFSIGSRSFDEHNCAGRYLRLSPVTLKIGDSVTVRTPLEPPLLPQSADPSVLKRTSLSHDGRKARFTAVGPGATTLDLKATNCDKTIFSPLPTPSGTPAAGSLPIGICHVLRVVTIAD